MSDTCFNSNDNKKSVNKLGGEGKHKKIRFSLYRYIFFEIYRETERISLLVMVFTLMIIGMTRIINSNFLFSSYTQQL